MFKRIVSLGAAVLLTAAMVSGCSGKPADSQGRAGTAPRRSRRLIRTALILKAAP